MNSDTAHKERNMESAQHSGRLENTNNKDYSNEKFEISYTEIEGTPFKVAQRINGEDKQYHVIMGNHKVTIDSYNTEAKAITEAKKVNWIKVMAVIQIMVEEEVKLNKK